MRLRPSYSNIVATLCLVGVATGTAVAANQGGSTPSTTIAASTPSTIAACAVKKGKKRGTVRIVSAGRKCRKAERKISWATASTPTGAVMYFDLTACPAGWSSFAPAHGRYVVGLRPGGTLERAVGTALAEGEDRATGRHTHTITDPGHSHSGPADSSLSGGNVQVQSFQGSADPGTLSLTTNLAATGITVNAAGEVTGTNAPYVQLLACRKD
jgi:hypothetical protein